MTEASNPAKEMIRQINTEIYNRMQRGAMNYQRDMKTLLRHAELATEMNDRTLEAQCYSYAGILAQNTGHFTRAAELQNKAVEMFQSLGDTRRAGRAQINLGEIYRRLGDNQQAFRAYQQAHELSKQVDDRVALVIGAGNMGLTCLAMEDYARAKEYFLDVLNLTASDPWEHINAIVEAKRGLAEVHLANRNFYSAWKLAGEAMKLASGRNLYLLLAEVNLTLAHIAETDPDLKEQPSVYYKLSREQFRQGGTRDLLARALLNEARYQQQRHRLDEAHRLASEAKALFEELKLNDEARLASEILSPSENVS